MATTATQSVATQALKAFNAADLDAFRELCAEDVVYVEAGTGRRIEGVDAYVEALRAWKEALPDVRGEVRRALVGPELVAQDVLWEGTHTGDLPTPGRTIPATGVRVAVTATLWLTVRDGRLREVEHHLDVLSLLTQIGALG